MKSLCIFTIIITLVCALSAQEASYQQQLKLIPVAEEGDYGSAVDIEGDWLMIGAEDASVDFLNSGTVYVYKKDSGVPIFVKKIVSSDATGLNRFGNSLSVENSTMVVGAWAKAAQSGGSSVLAGGKAYIFEKDEGGTDNWGEVKAIQAPVPASLEYYGFSVDIGENIIAISGHRNSDIAAIAGKVYLYGRNTGGANNWGFIKAVTEVDGAANYEFGKWVEVTDNYLAVYSYSMSNQGAVHLFHKDQGGTNNWGHKKTIVSNNPSANHLFGDETSLDGDQLLIGGFREINSNTVNTGRAFLYSKDEGGVDNWGLVKTFEPTITEAGTEYGVSVDLNGDYLIIGAEEESSLGGSDAGAGYIYHRNQGGADNWGLVNKIFSCDADEEDEFGTAVAIDGGQAIIGADDDSGVSTNAGAAYLFQQSTAPLALDNSVTSTTNFLQYHSGLTITSSAQINMMGDTARFISPTAIELENNFAIHDMTTFECIIDDCN